MNRFELTLDLDKRGGVAQWVTLRQGDHNGTELRATIYDHGTQAGGGYTCRVSIRLPGEGNEYYRETATYTNGVAVVTVDEEYAAAIVGVTEGYFELLQGDAVIASTESFGVRILRSAQDGAVPGDKYDSAIEDALAELDEATGRISQMVVDATEEYLEAHPELTTTVEDNSLTDVKLIQSGGILDRVARLWHRLDNLLTATPAEADALTVSDAAKTPLAGLALYGRSTQDGTPTPDAPVSIQSVTPNLYTQTMYPAGATHSTVGISIVHNEDGTCTCTGTATSSAWLWGGGSSADDRLYVTLPAGTYTACGSYYVAGQKKVDGTVSTLFNTTQGQRTFTLTETTDVKIVPVVPNGATVVNAIVWAALYGGPKAYPYVPYGYAGMWSIGKNLVTSDDLMWRHGSYNGTTGEEANSTTRMTLTKNAWFPVAPSTKYTVSVASGYKAMVYRYDASGGFIAHQAGFVTGSATFTTEANCAWCSVLVGRTDDGSMASEVPSSFGLQVEVGSAATAYQTYAESTTPIDLQGNVLRSLPDGTRDEVTIDQYGHAVLTQRVEGVTLDGSSDETVTTSTPTLGRYFEVDLPSTPYGATTYDKSAYQMCSVTPYCANGDTSAHTDDTCAWGYVSGNRIRVRFAGGIFKAMADVAEFRAWLAEKVVQFDYKLATPVTIDLGTINPVALQGPDMTAQAVPTAPFALTYERDLNVTLARLEAAIADAATA